MSRKTRRARSKVSSRARSVTPFIWPLGQSQTQPDEMNTSFGPRIDADRWDFHDGIDLPAPVGTPVYAMADGIVHRAGPANKTGPDQGFGSTHILLKVVDPTDGQDDLFIVYLHLDSIAEKIIPNGHVSQCDMIGAVGQEDATYPHLHFEFRKGEEPKQENSVHPLHYLNYPNKANFTNLRLDRCNFYRGDGGDRRLVRLRFDVVNRREGDVQGVDVELTGQGSASRSLHVDFDDRDTIASDKGDQHAFNERGIAVEGYQKSNLKGEGLARLHYGVMLQDINPAFETVKLQVLDVKNEKPKRAEFSLPKLGVGKQPINRRAGFEESEPFPPQDWALHLLTGNVCQPDAVPTGGRILLCQDLQSSQGALIRAGLRFALPVDRAVRPMSWRLRADINPVELEMDEGLALHPIAFLTGDDFLAAACLRKISNDEFATGVLIRSTNGLFREKIDVDGRKIARGIPARWELDLIRLGTRQTTAVLRLDNKVVARINGDTTSMEPDAVCVGIAHRHSGLQITLHIDRLRLTEAPR